MTNIPTFREQAAEMLASSAKRKRSPIRFNTVKTYRSAIDANLNPLIGDLPLDTIGNSVVKSVVSELAAQGLGENSIRLHFTIIKRVRKSAVNSDGEPRFPYLYNTDFIDLPSGEPQKRPVASAQAVEAAISSNCKGIGPLVAVLAGTGLRIGEALCLAKGVDPASVLAAPSPGVFNYWIPSESKIVVKTQQSGGPTKTKAGEREIDLCSELNNYMKKEFSEKNILFPLTEDSYRDRLELCGIIGGFHSLRRFRTTHLNQMSVPSGMEYFWTGHAAKDVHGRYVNVGEEIQNRKTEAERVGLGFKLPEAVCS